MAKRQAGDTSLKQHGFLTESQLATLHLMNLIRHIPNYYSQQY